MAVEGKLSDKETCDCAADSLFNRGMPKTSSLPCYVNHGNTGLKSLPGNTASAFFSLFPRCFLCVHEAHSHASKIERISLRTIARALEHPWNKTLSLGGDFQQFPGVEAIESTVSGRWESNPRPKLGKVAHP